MSNAFTKKIIDAVNMIPRGYVASYGQIALMVGFPRGARIVGQVLNSLEEDILNSSVDIPWWRVINNAGRISIKGTKYNDQIIQKEKLEADGIVVNDKLELDIKKYRFSPSSDQLKKLKISTSNSTIARRFRRKPRLQNLRK